MLGLVVGVDSGRDAGGDVIGAHVVVEVLVVVVVVVSELGLVGVALGLVGVLVLVRAPGGTVARAAARPALATGMPGGKDAAPLRGAGTPGAMPALRSAGARGDEPREGRRRGRRQRDGH